MKRSAAEWLYKAALGLYPPSFQRQFGSDMLMDFRDAYTARQARGSWMLAAYLLHTVVDLVSTLFTQWSRTDSIRIATLITGGNLGLWIVTLWIASREWPHGPITAASLLQLSAFVSVTTVLTVIATIVNSRRSPTDPVIHEPNS